jgi:hypothetical protein
LTWPQEFPLKCPHCGFDNTYIENEVDPNPMLLDERIPQPKLPTLRRHSSSIEDLLEKTREHYARADLSDYFNGDDDLLATAHVGLDTAEDAMLALAHYEKEGIGSDDGEKYLRLYGFLQAIFLQQDAIKKLQQLFVGDFSEPPDTSAWRRLRELRNLTVGHPIDKGRGKEPRKRPFITRVSLETGGFNYQVWNQIEGDLFERADLLVKYAEYKQEAATILEKVLTALSGVADELF